MTLPMKRLTPEEIGKLDPYQFMAELGKQVIHPGGKRSTAEVYSMADLRRGQRVLDIGCGVGTTAIEIAQQFECNVVASDIDTSMLEKADAKARRAGIARQFTIKRADIQNMPFADNEFDTVIVEAVTMFVNRDQAVSEIHRVCKSGGRVVEHEFVWRKKPTPEARKIFEGEVCPGIKFDTTDDWLKLYETHGFRNEKSATGPFVMMSPTGFVQDEGIGGTLAMMRKTFSRSAYLRKMMWLTPRILRVRSSLGYVVFSCTKVA